ncbi:hypothetical protein ABZ929_00055 [Streptomyces physcomitrii]|uniref:SCO2583 family membrane protein n=1 Tax=Streptomyces physcomitrii TaxID=2724184 RepID=UPI0033C30E35
MSGPGDPPQGTPEGAPGGGDDEYRSVVFDESFVRAAQLQEFSAEERIADPDHIPAVRRTPRLHRGLTRQALVLVLLLAVAFGTAIYIGVRHPYQSPTASGRRTEPLRMTVIPLAPPGRVPGAPTVRALFRKSPAARFAIGGEGIRLPAAKPTPHFSDSQIMSALTTAKDYLVASSLDPQVVGGGSTEPVRELLDPGQTAQFDESFARPVPGARYAATGWAVRLNPGTVRLADPEIRVQGTVHAAEADSRTLEVTSEHTFVYAVRPAGQAGGVEPSLFTVHRELHFRFDREDLRAHRAELLVSYVQAGPLDCAVDWAGGFSPVLAGQRASGKGPAAGTDPYARGAATALCGALAPHPAGGGAKGRDAAPTG